MSDFNSTCIAKAEKTSVEEMDVDKETENGTIGENTGETEKKMDVKNAAQEAEDPFKKPALFSAPSLVSKRAGVLPTSAHKKTSQQSDNSKEADKPKNLPSTADLPVGTTVSGKEEESGSNNGHSTQENDNRTVDSTNQSDKEEESIRISPKSVQELKPRFSVQSAPVCKFKPGPPLPYAEPPWGGVSETPYSFEILKNGTIVDTVPLTQSYFVVGRLPECDVSLEHPSISRHHAVVQYRRSSGEEGTVGEEAGFYAYDLGSTHGTFLNKNKIPPKTYIRLRVGHVLKFGGSTRLFILQGPEFDEEAESDLTVTELKERAKKHREDLEKRMMGDGSDDDDDDDDEEKEEKEKGKQEPGSRGKSEEAGCSWGIEEDIVPEEDENEENPFATEFQEDQEAAYLKDPKKALQGFFDREGEELEYEYDEKAHSTWLCRVKLPVDDAAGKQLVAEVTHTGKKKEAAIQCSLEACRILEARGLLRQEAVSRKRKKKNWEEEDFYDSDDDTFLDRTGVVEKKRTERMKRAGKIEERPDTYDSLVEKLAAAERELAETEKKLNASGKGGALSSSEDTLDAFMSEVRSEGSLDGVERRKLHVHVTELRREAHRLRRLVELTRPAQLPALQSSSPESDKPKKLTLPLFGAMKGGSKFKLKTGTIGKLPPKRAELPPNLLNLKELPPGAQRRQKMPLPQSSTVCSGRTEPVELRADEEEREQHPPHTRDTSPPSPGPNDGGEKVVTQTTPKKKEKKKMYGPSRAPAPLSTKYPEDDPDYCVWMPPAGQSGDGRTHLNEKYGY
ncbi:hypothetical protein AAFF_G00387980 [Aldrovandia affinis]|uniref:FHA domain-containing protein n=1 Tax=Aldrovandia affinis TaxID=143900 RepID=A0AAD7WLB1_9TELE|nr:hypothetical protein AAFF_G00387980 [Aldrovandia affinis]